MTSKTVVGRLGQVPEVRAAGDKHVVNFSVAETKRKFDRDSNQWVDDFTIWHNVESWQNADAIAQLAQGTLVIVEGEERDGSYEDRQTGKKVSRIILRARTVGTVVRDAPRQQQSAGQPWSTGGDF
ncbi:single-stranded DNA-binding protein [Microbacterium sp. 77mftsu3.1]|uniref:single-stranded DNA-binding protein n=1 Tax=Microbacterium sp. 77mftsu3.1 TaxID=1761802 RepID=UPI00035E69A8|nr:single-stranded DNA-binding protein [Microbacterium sp. 77mftsu3.1]SDG22850.1 single-strand DNA-binding protein [Microbacterium sp. 77mftsu3.1]